MPKLGWPTAGKADSRLPIPPTPEVFGVLRQIHEPSYEAQVDAQIQEAIAKKGKGDLNKLFRNDDLWTVEYGLTKR